MAINFTKTVQITPVDEPEIAAARVEDALARLFSGDSSFQEDLAGGGVGEWRLRDPGDTTATGLSLQAVFSEFREHELTPRMLSTKKSGTTLSGDRFSVHVYYFIDRGICDLDVSGANRITVDGVAATCERIKTSLERVVSEASVSSTPSSALVAPTESRTQASAPTVITQPNVDPQPREGGQPSNQTWLARTWRDHTATFLVTVVGGVLVIVVALMLGLKP